MLGSIIYNIMGFIAKEYLALQMIKLQHGVLYYQHHAIDSSLHKSKFII